jgi:hypothetical protein
VVKPPTANIFDIPKSVTKACPLTPIKILLFRPSECESRDDRDAPYPSKIPMNDFLFMQILKPRDSVIQLNGNQDRRLPLRHIELTTALIVLNDFPLVYSDAVPLSCHSEIKATNGV